MIVSKRFRALSSKFLRLDIHLGSLGTAMDYAQKYVNKYLFNYVLTLALRHRPDLKSKVQVPSQITLAPHLYFDMGDLPVADADSDNLLST
jgi:hypothetical protein